MTTLNGATVCVVGLGYVGWPLAQAFSRSLKVIGYDNSEAKLAELKKNNSEQNLIFTDKAWEISKANFIIICVPTPVTNSKEPDLSFVKGAAKVVGQNLRRGCTVILESTVYPGVTEEIVKPILEKESGLKCCVDFKIGYSPERINPGDDEHSIDKVTKIVSGIDAETTDIIAELYQKVTPQVFKAKDIRTAEAAKLVENIQRDLNIALVNEFAIMFAKMGLNTREVLKAAATKWNFHAYSPGMVGGHCIPVVPHYLVYKSRELGYEPELILAGRAVNDNMPHYVAELAVRGLNAVGKATKGSKVLIIGLTYKEDVPDTREAPARGIIQSLREYEADVLGYDPLLDDAESQFNIKVVPDLKGIKVDAVILAVVHKALKGMSLDKLKGMMNSSPVLIDVRGFFSAQEAANKGFYYRTL